MRPRGQHVDRRLPEHDVDPARTALLVIDPVNDFLHEEGAAWEMTKSTVKKNDVVAQLARLTQGARASGVPVIFGPTPTPPRTTPTRNCSGGAASTG